MAEYLHQVSSGILVQRFIKNRFFCASFELLVNEQLKQSDNTLFPNIQVHL